MRVYKSKRVPLLHFSALCDIFRKNFFSKISSFFPKNVLRFLSLRYSADLRRSRLVLINVQLMSEIGVKREASKCLSQKQIQRLRNKRVKRAIGLTAQ